MVPDPELPKQPSPLEPSDRESCQDLSPRDYRDSYLIELAKRQGGTFHPDGFMNYYHPATELKYTDISVAVSAFVTPTKSPREYILISAELPVLREFSFELADQNLIQNFLDLIGFKDLQIGEAEIDKRFLIKSDQPELVKDLLKCQKVKDIILDPRYGKITLSRTASGKHRLEMEISGTDFQMDLGDIEAQYERFCATLESLKSLGVI